MTLAFAMLLCSMAFELESNYKPRGDQSQAIAKLLKSIEAGNRHQTLLGVTGSGKTFTMANVIRELDRPTLVISHNKTLAAQLYSEFKQFFPRNAVEYFVSYFDYYQPEAYIPRSDTYIEKDSSINEEIERLRLSATSALLSRRDAIVVASVSCIYGVTSPEDYLRMLLTVKKGQQITREAVLGRLVDMLYERNDMNFSRGKFRVRGDVVEVYPATADEEAIRLEFFGDEIDAITRFDPLTGHAHEGLSVITFYPAKQFVTPADKLNRALASIRNELDHRIVELESQSRLLEAQRLKMRTSTTSKCCRRWDSATGSRIIRAISPAACRDRSQLRSSIFSRRITCSSWTSRTPRSRRSAGCMKATDRARRSWWNTDSGCRARSIIGR